MDEVRAAGGGVARQRMQLVLQGWQRRADGRARYLSWYANTTDHVLAAAE